MPDYRRYLPKDVREILLILASHMVPSTSDLDLSGREPQIENGLSHFVFAMTALYRRGLIWGLRLFKWLPFFSGLGFKPFTRLSKEKQLRYMDNWALSDSALKREFFRSVKAIVMMVCFTDKRIWNYLGYEVDQYVEERIQLREKILKNDIHP